MQEILLGAGIFMLGSIFGLFVSSLAVAASREMPRPNKKNEEN